MDILRYFSVFIFYNIILLFSLLCMIKFRMTLVRFEWYWRRQSNCSEQEYWSVHTTLWIEFPFLIFLVKRMEPLRIFTILVCYFVLIQGKTHFLKNVYHHKLWLQRLPGLPSLRDSIRQPLHVVEGEDALITCVVRNLESNTLLWKKEDTERRTPRILTAGESRVTSDSRFNVLHDSGILLYWIKLIIA